MQGFENILVLTDFTPASWEALKYGAMFHNSVQSNITLLHVVPSKVNGNGKDRDKTNVSIGLVEQKIQLLQKEMSQNGGTRTVVLNGNVTDEILKHLEAVHYDLIVMGANGNGGLNSDLGRNTRTILQSAGVPVMVLPSKKQLLHQNGNGNMDSPDLDLLAS
ncbi:MAG: universal stress protein [Bacteroidota bacterium]